MKNIVIIPNESKDIGLSVTKRLIDILSEKAEIKMESRFLNTGFDVDFCENEKLYEKADFVIVLGGDGTILGVAEPCARKNIPILGINLGTVGFMTEVKVEDMEEAVNSILSGKYKTQKRMMMKITVIKGGRCSGEYHALNDVVISKKESSMIGIQIHSQGEKINEYKADGLIISTPTGSTGYSLSAGGPVADPTMELFIASPICAHMLHARPALMPSSKEILLTSSDKISGGAILSVDGDIKEHLSPDDEVLIKKSQYYASIAKIGNQSFYDVLIDKLR
ncbi:MAG: NAD(+)/NADH kinase [Clostridia bacterium]|nr:NAD(+)/NADH kinase [Clostridia bacterium]